MAATTEDESDRQTLIPLEDYKEPAMPPKETFRLLLGRARAAISREEAKPFIASDQLHRVPRALLDEIVGPPACGPVIDELDRTIQAWLQGRNGNSHVKPIILPPCDQHALVETWAKRRGYALLPAPARGALIQPELPELPSLEGDGVLVIPQLEAWLLRHRSGLRLVRALLAALDVVDRPVVVGCNSWAWAFLAKAVRADLLFPDAATFRAFDADRLFDWFSELAEAESTGSVRFRLPATGEDVLSRNEDGALTSTFLATLAGRSLGIPWVAWHMWRRSMRSNRKHAAGNDDGEDDEAASGSPETNAEPGERTLWVAAPDEYILPGSREQTALLVLHALLIHGPLAPEHLRLVLPIVGESHIVSVLVKAGFLERSGDRFACCATAYADVRSGLASAGLPTDAI